VDKYIAWKSNNQIMEELIPLNLVIGDRTYRVKVAPKDEEVVRKTIKIINDKLIEFKMQFAGKDMQDYIAMVVLWYATQSQAGGGSGESAELAKMLQKMDAQLDQALAS
jgi:hypothetical protein